MACASMLFIACCIFPINNVYLLFLNMIILGSTTGLINANLTYGFFKDQKTNKSEKEVGYSLVCAGKDLGILTSSLAGVLFLSFF